MMQYRSGEEILTGDRIELHGNPGLVEFIVNDPDEPEWGYLGQGVMVSELSEFGRLFLPAKQLADYEGIEFVARAKDYSK
jgi:hypothetical protein